MLKQSKNLNFQAYPLGKGGSGQVYLLPYLCENKKRTSVVKVVSNCIFKQFSVLQG